MLSCSVFSQVKYSTFPKIVSKLRQSFRKFQKILNFSQTQAELVDSGGDDDEQSQQLGIGKDVLDKGGPFDLPTINKGQHT